MTPRPRLLQWNTTPVTYTPHLPGPLVHRSLQVKSGGLSIGINRLTHATHSQMSLTCGTTHLLLSPRHAMPLPSRLHTSGYTLERSPSPPNSRLPQTLSHYQPLGAQHSLQWGSRRARGWSINRKSRPGKLCQTLAITSPALSNIAVDLKHTSVEKTRKAKLHLLYK